MSKIAVVGCQSSGKTVFMASLSDYFRAGQRPDQSSWLIPENSDAYKFTERRNYEMRVQHMWPDATLVNPMSLKWSLRQKNGAQTDIEMLEFSGEVFRAAFREEGSSPQHKEAAEKLVSYLIDADFVVVLVGLNELFRSHDEDRQIFEDDIESTWVTRGLIDFVKKNLPPSTGLIIALTQADLYKNELEKFGSAANVLKARWPMIYALYPDIPVVAVASVSKTTADGRPAEGYTTEGVLPVMKAYSEFVYGNPAGLIAEMDDLAEAIQNMGTASPIEVFEQKLAKHKHAVEELSAKVTIVDALYDDVIKKHSDINKEAAALVESLRSILFKDIEDRQDAKIWDELRERFPTVTGTINAYEIDSRDQYKAILADRAKKEESERKAREEEARRMEESARRDEKRRRQLELEEKERQAEAEKVKIEQAKAKVKSRSFVIRAVAVLIVLCGMSWGVKEYYDNKRRAELAEQSRIEKENAIKLALAKEKEDAAQILRENNKKEELRKQQIEAENKRKELVLKEQEVARQREAEQVRAKEKEMALKKAADERAAAEARQKIIEAEQARQEAVRRDEEAKQYAEREAARKAQEIADAKARELALRCSATNLLVLARNASRDGSFDLLAKHCGDLFNKTKALNIEERKEFDTYSHLIDLWRCAEKGDNDARRAVGDYFAKINLLIASKWYGAASDAGDVVSCCRLGDLYLKKPSQLYNPAKARECYKKAAEQGNVQAQARLGDMLATAVGVEGDQILANEWYKKAAEAHDVNASIALAKRMAKGTGYASPDFESAYKCLETVEGEDESGRVQFELGNLYCNTIMANKRFSIDKAQFHYLKAKAKGFTDKELDANLKIFGKIIRERKNPAVPES